MTRKRDSRLKRTKKDSITEGLSSGSCHIVLDTSPPDYVEKISRYLESSELPSGLSENCNDPAEAESDSGDSLFITQEPVPGAVRRGRRHRIATSPRDLEESEDDSSSSGSVQKSTAERERNTRYVTLPKYAFPFLKIKRSKGRGTFLPVSQNISLHNATMGGFFKCVSELWQGFQYKHMAQSLPTVDMDGNDISPLSEEEETAQVEDIKVVEKKRFLARLKTKKCSQPWYTPAKKDENVNQQKKRRRESSNTNHDMSQEGKRNKTCLSSDIDASDEGGPCGIPAERGTDDTHEVNVLGQTETSTTRCRMRGIKKILFQEEDREEMLCTDSDATVCEFSQHEGSQILGGREVTVPATEAQTDDRSQNPPSLPQVCKTNNDGVSPDSTLKKKKKKKNKGNYGSESYMENLLFENILRLEERDLPDSVQTKRNGKNIESLAENVRQEVEKNLESDVILEDSGTSVMCNREKVEKKKKKKKKKNVEDGEEVEQLQDTQADGTETQRKTKHEEDDLEHTENSQETLGSSYEKKRRKHKTKKQSSSLGDTQEDPAVSSSNEGVTSEQSTGLKVKKKKKEMISEGVDFSSAPDDGEKVEHKDNFQTTIDGSEVHEAEQVTKKKKKKKKEKMDEISSRQVPEDSVAQSIDAASVWKREKKRTSFFLKADSEEKDDEPHPWHSSALTSVADGVCADVESESAEIAGNFSDEVIKKKKKKRKMPAAENDLEEDHGSDFVEPNVTEQETALNDESAEIVGNFGDEVIKKKKKKRKMPAAPDNLEEDYGSDFVDPNITEQETALNDRSAEIAGNFGDEVIKKKKKKKKKMMPAAQDNLEEDYGSDFVETDVTKQEAALTEESAEIAGNSGDGVSKKKKKKRKLPAAQYNLEEDHGSDFVEPNVTEQETVLTNSGVKRKKKNKRPEHGSVTSTQNMDTVANEGQSQSDEEVMLKRKSVKTPRESTRCQY